MTEYLNGDRYYSFPSWCKDHYGHKLYRIPLDAGMTCPNRDGTIDHRGCIFCDEGGSGDFAIHYSGQPMTMDQLKFGSYDESVIGHAVAYFQAYTNTYAPLHVLRHLFTCALQDPFFAGLSIATRPDCLGEDVQQLLTELRQTYPNKFIWIELGLQSIHEESAVWMRRGYPLSVFDQAVAFCHRAQIPVMVHVIFGLPNETEAQMMDTIRHLNTVGIDGIKIQLLQYLRGTDLGLLYQMGKVTPMSEYDYVTAVVHAISLLDSKVAVHRLTGDAPKELLLAPLWSVPKQRLINLIRHQLKASQITQGCQRSEL